MAGSIADLLSDRALQHLAHTQKLRQPFNGCLAAGSSDRRHLGQSWLRQPPCGNTEKTFSSAVS